MSEGKTKKCNMCGRVLPLDAFAYSMVGVMGRFSRCRECHKLSRKPSRKNLIKECIITKDNTNDNKTTEQ